MNPMIILELIRFVAWVYFDIMQTTLVRNYLNDPILAVRQQSLKTISRLDRQEDVDYLLEQLDKESEEEFRQELLEVISQTSSEAVVALLKDYLGELEPDVKNLVIDAIGYDGHEENKKLLLPLLNDSNNKVRANGTCNLSLW